MNGFIVVSIHLDDNGQDSVGVSNLYPTIEAAKEAVLYDAQNHYDECMGEAEAEDNELDSDRPTTYEQAIEFLFDIDEDVEVRELIEVQS